MDDKERVEEKSIRRASPSRSSCNFCFKREDAMRPKGDGAEDKDDDDAENDEDPSPFDLKESSLLKPELEAGEKGAIETDPAAKLCLK